MSTRANVSVEDARAAAITLAEQFPNPDDLRHYLEMVLGLHWRQLARGKEGR